MLALDIETYSEVDLIKSGVYVYAEHPSFEILLISYQLDDKEVKTVSLIEGEELPKDILEALTDPGVTKTAWNANFERTCLAKWYGKEMPPEQWQDTMILASFCGLPRSLADCGKVLGLNKQKLVEGKNLIQYFSKPCRATKANGGRTRNLPEHDEMKWLKYMAYNQRDVEAEQEILKRIERYSRSDKELKLWALDQNINDRGVKINPAFALAATKMDLSVKAELREKAKAISGLENPNSVAQIKAWIKEKTGVEIESLNKREMPAVLEQLEDPEVLEFLDIRSSLRKTSTAKYEAMLRSACRDKRIRGLTQFYGANRTGRWAGRLVQMQNLPQNKLPDEDLDIARQLVLAGGKNAIQATYDDLASVLSQLIRTAFVPEEGKKFIVSDFSAIEARVIAWLAGETWRLDVFNGDGKIYEASAEKMFNLPKGSVKKGDPMRQKGKIAELALGYGGASGALKSMGALDMGLEEEELRPLVESWRGANKKITKFWWDVDRAARELLTLKKPTKMKNGIMFFREGTLMRIKLPSGRALSYVNPRISGDNITYDGILTAGAWGRIETYGPKLVENIVQAVARDCLAESMIRLEKLGIPIVFHVHDEVICEVNGYSAEDIAEIMSRPIPWAKGLPLKADAYECEYYRKD